LQSKGTEKPLFCQNYSTNRPIHSINPKLHVAYELGKKLWLRALSPILPLEIIAFVYLTEANKTEQTVEYSIFIPMTSI